MWRKQLLKLSPLTNPLILIGVGGYLILAPRL